MEEELREDYRDILATMWLELMSDMTNVEENLRLMTSFTNEVVIDSTIKPWNLEINKQ